MPSTTSAACPFCGAPLRRRTALVGGREMFCGWERCGCEGSERSRAEEARREAERAAREEEGRRARAYRRAGIPPRFAAAEHPMAEAVADGARRGRGAYVCGPVGTGKTHLACAAARILVDGGMSVRVTDMLGVLARLKGTWGGEGTEDGVLSGLSRCGLLVLDDLGKEAPGDWALSQVFRVVNDRYESMRPVVVTTQYGRADLIRRLARNGDAETAVAVVSRLAEMCDRYELSGRDRRLGNG